jgi:hypothetical protein
LDAIPVHRHQGDSRPLSGQSRQCVLWLAGAPHSGQRRRLDRELGPDAARGGRSARAGRGAVADGS